MHLCCVCCLSHLILVVVARFSVSTLLIIGITATASTSREAVLNPPDEETEESQEDEEDDYDDGDDDVAFHDCGGFVCVEAFEGVLTIEWFDGGVVLVDKVIVEGALEATR